MRINGEMRYLWRAVDHEGEVLESFVTKEPDKAAALKFIEKARKRHGSPKAITTDGLRSYGAALKELGNVQKREVGRWANNRAENSHLPFRRRERAMLRFRRMRTLQQFASVHAFFHNPFSQERHLVDRQTYKDRPSAASRSGGPSRPEPLRGKGACALAETSCGWSDSTATPPVEASVSASSVS